MYYVCRFYFTLFRWFFLFILERWCSPITVKNGTWLYSFSKPIYYYPMNTDVNIAWCKHLSVICTQNSQCVLTKGFLFNKTCNIFNNIRGSTYLACVQSNLTKIYSDIWFFILFHKKKQMLLWIFDFHKLWLSHILIYIRIFNLWILIFNDLISWLSLRLMWNIFISSKYKLNKSARLRYILQKT